MSFELRAGRLEDAEGIASVVNELGRALYGEDELTADEISFWFELPNVEILVATLPDGRIAGYADLTDQAEHRRFWIDPRVPPGVHHDEVAGALLDALVDRACEAATAEAVLKVSVPSVYERIVPLLEERGFEFARQSFRMETELESPSEAPECPSGVSVRSFVPGDEEAVYRVHQEAFADQFEFTPQSYDDWRIEAFHEPFDPALWLLAVDVDEIAGICLCRSEWQGDSTLGWVGALGVRKAWRRRGLGRALLLQAFADLRALGKRAVGLGVDGLNPTGAVRLYERVGMRVTRRYDQYRKSLSA